jgi:hypothetical protein
MPGSTAGAWPTCGHLLRALPVHTARHMARRLAGDSNTWPLMVKWTRSQGCCAAIPIPRRGWREGGSSPEQWAHLWKHNDEEEEKQYGVDGGLGNGVLLLQGQEEDMRSWFGHLVGKTGSTGMSSPPMLDSARVIRCGGWRRQPITMKPGAKRPYDQGD